MKYEKPFSSTEPSTSKTIRVPTYIRDQLKEISEKTGISQAELVCRYISVLWLCKDVLEPSFIVAVNPYGKML